MAKSANKDEIFIPDVVRQMSTKKGVLGSKWNEDNKLGQWFLDQAIEGMQWINAQGIKRLGLEYQFHVPLLRIGVGRHYNDGFTILYKIPADYIATHDEPSDAPNYLNITVGKEYLRKLEEQNDIASFRTSLAHEMGHFVIMDLSSLKPAINSNILPDRLNNTLSHLTVRGIEFAADRFSALLHDDLESFIKTRKELHYGKTPKNMQMQDFSDIMRIVRGGENTHPAIFERIDEFQKLQQWEAYYNGESYTHATLPELAKQAKYENIGKDGLQPNLARKIITDLMLYGPEYTKSQTYGYKNGIVPTTEKYQANKGQGYVR